MPKIVNVVQRPVCLVREWRACAIRLSISLILSGRFLLTIRRCSGGAAATYPLLRSVFISPRIRCHLPSLGEGTGSFNITYLPKHFLKTRPLTATLREKVSCRSGIAPSEPWLRRRSADGGSLQEEPGCPQPGPGSGTIGLILVTMGPWSFCACARTPSGAGNSDGSRPVAEALLL